MAAEIRKKWWSAPVGHLIWCVIALICMTLRKRVRLAEPEVDSEPWNKQSIISLWHNRVFVPCHVYRYVLHGKVPMSMLTSASKDGAILATVAKDYGMRAVRGSSHRRGVAGFMDMLRELKDGCSMCITPDGPKGPIYKCHPGAIKLASMSGLPLVPVCIQYKSYWRIGKAWDRFIIPKPFSRVDLIWGKSIYVPENVTDEQVKEYCAKLEQAMASGAPDLPEFPPIP